MKNGHGWMWGTGEILALEWLPVTYGNAPRNADEMISHLFPSPSSHRTGKIRDVFDNRRARFEFELLERFEAGMELRGTEIKSIRVAGVDFRDAFARFESGELYLENLYIAPYDKASYNNHDPRRKRKLLLHKKELSELRVAVTQRGLTIVPVKMYYLKGRLKIEIAIAKGKKLHDKREAQKAKDAKREMEAYR